MTVALLSAVLLGPTYAQAACSLKTADVPIELEGLRPLVAAKINGQEVKFLLDSGAFYNSVDARVAAQQKLRPAPVATTGTRFAAAARAMTSGAAGAEKIAGIVIAPAFEFAGSTYANTPFLTVDGLGDAAGILGQNFLSQVDVEYDFAGGVMRLVRPQGCEATDLAYWAKPGATYSVMPLESSDRVNAHTVAIIVINGVSMRGFFDTGAHVSFITARAAERAGVRTTDAGVKPAGFAQGLDRANIKTWAAPFSSIKTGDEEIRNTRLTIGESAATDSTSSSAPTFSWPTTSMWPIARASSTSPTAADLCSLWRLPRRGPARASAWPPYPAPPPNAPGIFAAS